MLSPPISRRAAVAVILAVAAAAPAEARSLAERFGVPAAASAKTVDHSVWDRLLSAYVVPGADGVNRIAYAKFKSAGHADLKTYVAMLESVDPTTLDRAEQFAYWANLYNAKTIDIILDKYPVKSIKNISLGGGLKSLVTGGPWQAKVAKVGGESLSLDDIEHQILRPAYKDPRVHYSVNCASIGCPNLPNKAFTGASLEEMLEAGAKAYVNHPRGVSVEGGKLKVSSIYSWFQADFGGSDAGVIAHLEKYAGSELKSKLKGITKIAGDDYDWGLNDAK
jgi:hypothetical protein